MSCSGEQTEMRSLSYHQCSGLGFVKALSLGVLKETILDGCLLLFDIHHVQRVEI